MHKLLIHSGVKDYQIFFEDDLKKLIKKIQKNYQAHFLIDKGVADRYKSVFSSSLGLSRLEVPALESNKTLPMIHRFASHLIANKVQKHHKIIVIGGGLVQDIGSFTAHVLLRGVEWVFIPTTLLAMGDSGVGSKSGINVGRYKNQVGSFHPPVEIYIHVPFLKTLPKTEILNGIGEIAKHAIIKGGRSYQFLSGNLDFIQSDQKKAAEVIYQSLCIKKEIVEADEFESGARRLLNYGHTFGHALEGYTKNKIPHGIGVSIGVDCANYISMQRGMIDEKIYKEIAAFVQKHIPYSTLSITSLDRYMDFLKRDKKVVGDSVYAILCRGIGKIEITKIKIDRVLKEQLKDYFEKFRN